jgi:kynurenine formamidase
LHVAGKGRFGDGAQVERFLRDRSNWGRWGSDDQAGLLNLVTREKRVGAAALVRSGTTVSLSRPFPVEPSPNNERPAEHYMKRVHKPGYVSGFALDYYAIFYHGSSCTHIDALCHCWGEEGAWNGRQPDEFISTEGAAWGGVEQYSEGIITRGVLLDIPRLRGTAYVTMEEPVRGDELEAAARAVDLTVTPGDAVIVRSGREVYDRDHPQWGSGDSWPGLDASCLTFLRDTDASVLVWDMQDMTPFGYDTPWTVHGAIWSFGLAVLDNAELSSLARTCESESRWEFMLIVAPLVVKGGTGSPVNPLAIF